MVRILLLAHKISNEDKKKVSVQNLGLSLSVHSCFLSWNESLLMLGGGHKQYFWGAQAPKCTPVALGLLLFWGAQGVILGGHCPEMPPWRRAWYWISG